MEELEMHFTKWKKWKGCLQYDSNYMMFWKSQNWRLGKKKKNQWLPEVKGQGETNDQSTEDF